VDGSLDWHLLDHPQRQKQLEYVRQLGKLYSGQKELWAADPDPGSFRWIDCDDSASSILIYERRIPDTDDHLIVILNLTPVPREGYRVGFPTGRSYQLVLNSDADAFGGSGFSSTQGVFPAPTSWQNQSHSAQIDLPPLSLLVYRPI
jgi:1,4-alpha-glucan branching enzyme